MSTSRTVSARLAEERPNPNIASYLIDADLLTAAKTWLSPSLSLGHVIIPRDNALVGHSPLAQSVFKASGLTIRIDLSHAENGTLISLAKKMGGWSSEGLEGVRNMLEQGINSGISPIDIRSAVKEVPITPPLETKDLLLKNLIETFDSAVRGPLAEDGGAMRICGIIDERIHGGPVTFEVAMTGACSTCGSSEEITLKKAYDAMAGLVVDMKEAAPNNRDIQSFNLRPFQLQKNPALIYGR